MAVYKLLDFVDIQTAVMEELKVPMSDLVTLNRVKRMVNMMYIDEVIPAARWWWLYGHTSVGTKPYYSTGTASVTPNQTTVTISVAPTSAQGDSGSFQGWKFSVDGKSDIYTIETHAALSTSITLDRGFNTELNAAANFRIWQDTINLPTDLRETIEVWHEYMRQPMEARGLQEFRKAVAQDPKLEGRPAYYSTYDFQDPSSGTGELESDRYRQMKVYPALSTYKTLVKIDYVKEANALDVDGDEPLMPIEDRIVLFYGALSLAWGSIGRNPEEASRNRGLFDQKLARMMGKIQDTLDKPRIEPESTYIVAKRGNRIGTHRSSQGLGSGSSFSAPTYLEGVTINGATVTGNFTVNSGITIDGRDISVDGASLDAHILASLNVHGIGSGNAVVGTGTTQTLTNKSISATNNTIADLNNSNIATTAAIDRTKTATGTAYRILANSSLGVMSENAALTANKIVTSDANGQLASSATSDSSLAYLADAAGLVSATLLDNTAATSIVTWAHASFTSIQLEYSLSRGAGNRESGYLTIVTDGSTAAIAQSAASIGTLGTTFTVDISGANVRLLYATISTGTNVTFKYTVRKWLA